MGRISDSDYKLISAEKAAETLSISLATFFELASQEKCRLLIDIPDAVGVYIKGRDLLKSRSGMFGTPANRRLETEPLVQVNREIEFLFIDPSECSPLIHRAQIRKKAFPAVGLMSVDGSVELFDSLSYTRRFPDPRLGELNIFDDFLTYQPPKMSLDWLGRNTEPTTEKSVLIQLSSLLIRARDVDKIGGAIGRDFGKFEPGDWTSAMLTDLNEASTYFLSSNRIAIPADKAKIRDWFQQRWIRRGIGKDVVEQAANAILPDDQYLGAPSRARVTEEAIDRYNEYTSTALVIMNEAAKEYWEEMQSSQTSKHYRKRDDIEMHLIGKGFTAKLASASAAIIRPDEFKKRRRKEVPAR